FPSGPYLIAAERLPLPVELTVSELCGH
ncbi:MAG: hypothetical protein QOJ75_869, partial [Chloroflexota bacterium]|nr:hypothetical protein [Chloroflexota bacterium]